eukprot:9495183-Pyramimonas_sp.AAC.1
MHNVLEDLGGPNPFQNSTANDSTIVNNSSQNGMNDQPSTLTVAQRTVFDTLTNIHQTGLHVLSGSPDAGKTFVTQQIIQSLHERNEDVILCGTTGAAATRLHSNAMTVHNFFRLTSSGSGFLPDFLPTHSSYQTLKLARVIIIDEVSMLTSQQLNIIMHRIAQVMEMHTVAEFLSEQLIVLIGDLCQLPPVCHHKVAQAEVCTECHITSSCYWPLVTSHFLHNSYRHASDPIYCEFLNTIRCTRVDQPYIDKILSHTYINVSEVQHHLGSDTVILCTHRHRAHAYNSEAMR